MVDTSDFSISYFPTNIYSVGTPHEIIMATLQHKPVLFVSPPIVFGVARFGPLQTTRRARLLQRLEAEFNPKTHGIPSLWASRWLAENFFDGFGLPPTQALWLAEEMAIDRQKRFPPKRPAAVHRETERRLPRSGTATLTGSCPTTTGCYGISTRSRFAVNTSNRS
jgi:hypothetical protein